MATDKKSLMKNFGGATAGVVLAFGVVFSPAAVADAGSHLSDYYILYGTGAGANFEKVQESLDRTEKRDGIKFRLLSGLGETDCFALFDKYGQEIVRVGPERIRSVVPLALILEGGEEISSITFDREASSCRDQEILALHN